MDQIAQPLSAEEEYYRSNILFDVHSTCLLKARNRPNFEPSSFFHMCWMDIQDGHKDKSLHHSWKRQYNSRLLGSDGSIGTVCASVRASLNLNKDVKN